MTRTRTKRPSAIRLAAYALALTSCEMTGAVEDPRPAEFDVSTWRLSDEPDFRVSGFEIDGDSVFFGPIAPFAAFTESGDIALAIAWGDHRVIFVDPAGAVLSSFGRMGRGPLEFQRLIAFTVNGNTAAAWDRGNQKVTIFTDGTFRREIALPLKRSLTFVGLLADRSIVVTPEGFPIEELWRSFPEDRIDEGEPRPYHLLSPIGERIGTLRGAPEPVGRWVEMRLESTGRRVANLHLPNECWPWPLHSARGDRLVIADTGAGRLFEVEHDGTTRSLFASPRRGTMPAEYVATVEAYIARWEELYGPISGASKRLALDKLGRPGDPLPAVWSSMVTDVRGDIWLQRATCAGPWRPESTSEWEVVAPDGTPKAVVSVPGDLTLLAVNGDRVLAAFYDELEIPYLALYRVLR